MCFSVELHCAALTLVSQVVLELVNSNLQVSLLHLQAGLSIMVSCQQYRPLRQHRHVHR